MRDNFHAVVNNTWYSILFDHKFTQLFCIEIFLVQKHSGKVLIIIIISFLIIMCCKDVEVHVLSVFL